MGSTLYLFMFMLFLLSCFILLTATDSSSSTTQQLCREGESSALLQFKHTFFINKFASSALSAYPKVESWKLEGEYSDCYSWYGVDCDKITGHVTGLDLSSSFLYGSINSNSSLFSLVHLHRLNLADNHFNYSQIPSKIGHLSRLVSLNLSHSSLFGQIPSEISKLSMLTSLDLSKNYDPWKYGRFLGLENLSLRNLVQNLTNLKELRLATVHIPTVVPEILANMSSLTVLDLQYCGLRGEFPQGIFLLPNLRKLFARLNLNLTGYLPEFHSGSRLEILDLGRINFSSKVPDSIGNLESLNYLDLGQSNFTGSVPASVGNLTQLNFLNLGANNFIGQVPSSLANLSQMTSLTLRGNNFDAGPLSLPLGKLPKLTEFDFGATNIHGEIPMSLANLTQLSHLFLGHNQIVGQFPSWVTNLIQLTILEVSFNQLQGTIPISFYQLKHLEYLDLAANHLSGAVDLDIFLKLQNLTVLKLSTNKLTVLAKNSANATLPKLSVLNLGACNLSEFPEFLQFHDELIELMFDHNKIHGQIPTWVWNSRK